MRWSRCAITGWAYPKKTRQKFFTLFPATNSTGIVGTGIGLNLVKELVTLHGGVVHVESRAGLGSTFTIRLPIKGLQSAAQTGAPMAATA
ncbi:MAG: HAMP domain-containing histidine kinase [Alphaproteobacteria bacterium]|nr:HAMP domain-containing histidine kinase [Alphaproteobacteria bacterium]